MTNSPPNRLPQLVNLSTSERRVLDSNPFLIGREPSSNLVLTDDFSSINHARIIWYEGNWWLEDLQSSNGTYVNETRISEPFLLSPGQIITVGHTQLRIE